MHYSSGLNCLPCRMTKEWRNREWEEGMYFPAVHAWWALNWLWPSLEGKNTSQQDPSMWSSPPKFQQSPSPPKYSTWLPSPSWFPYVLSRFILKYVWPTQFQRTMFSLIIPWIMFWTRREQALVTISKLQDDSRKDLDRQQWGCQKEGWWVAPCTRGATETETS